MKKLLTLVLAIVLCMGLLTVAHADGIKVGIINLDPAESGYREANVNDLFFLLKSEYGFLAFFLSSELCY